MKTQNIHFKRTAGRWRFKGNELAYIKEVLNSGFGSSSVGNMVQRLEASFAKRFGMKYAVTSTSGTTTLHLALAAFGVGPGDEVLLPVSTVISCPNAILYTGARPIFVDIDPDTFLIDPKDIERKITKKTKAIMVVHLCGLMCDMDKVMNIAKKHKLFVLEDCAQCYLGKNNKGRIAGTIGDVGSFSFENSKHLSTGDGGILITNNEKLAKRMRQFSGQGYKSIGAINGQVLLGKDTFQDPKYLRHETFGWNYRLPELAAAVGLAQLERIDELVSKRILMGTMFLNALREIKCDWVIPQKLPKGYINSYWTFAVRYEGEKKYGISWYDFRKKFIEFGGDGFYAGWPALYKEGSLQLLNKTGKFFPDEIKVQGPSFKGFLKNNSYCPNLEKVHPKLMHFTTNQGTQKEMAIQAHALKNTIEYFQSKHEKT